jgi:hypothetical protein
MGNMGTTGTSMFILCLNYRACPSHKTCWRARRSTWVSASHADFKPMTGAKRCGNWLKKPAYSRERRTKKENCDG